MPFCRVARIDRVLITQSVCVCAQAPEGAIHVSVSDQTGIPELKGRVREMLVVIRDLLDIYIAKQRQIDHHQQQQQL